MKSEKPGFSLQNPRDPQFDSGWRDFSIIHKQKAKFKMQESLLIE
jgi:hypothetical protein